MTMAIVNKDEAATEVNGITYHKDMVNGPAHYQGTKVIEFIEAFDLNFARASVIKYVSRAKLKNNELEDLKKAKWYIEREILRLEKNNE
jgi:hypothetical protein